jgi:anti-sigma B factor antagonist
MEILFRDAETVTVVEISGSVDGLTAGELMTALGERVKSGSIRLVADFRGVEYVSSAGLRALLATMKETRQHGGDFRLADVRPDVSRVLELSGFTSILKVYRDSASAVASFGAHA